MNHDVGNMWIREVWSYSEQTVKDVGKIGRGLIWCNSLECLRDEVTGEWRKLHNEELNDLYSLPNIVWVVKSSRMRWAGHVARMGEDRGVHRVLVGKPKGKRPLGRPRRRWEDNIKMDRQEVGGVRWGLDGVGSG